MNDRKQSMTPMCICQRDGVNPPLSAVAVYAQIPGQNEQIATVTRCEYCGFISRLEASARAKAQYRFTTAGLERLLSQTRVPSFTPAELAAGSLPAGREYAEPPVVLRPVQGYNPDAHIEPSRGDLL